MNKTWFVTGASRGIGAEIAKAALAAGDRVVATARTPASIVQALGTESDRLLALPLDVTDRHQAQHAVDGAVERFGTIDVLVNNAGYGQLGLFEEITPDSAEAQFNVNVLGLFDVTRAVLPVMRQQRSGHIFNLSSVGGIQGVEFAALYCASKFAVEGFSESLAQEVAQFGIKITIVEPGYFRTDFLDASSVHYGELPIADYEAYSQRLKQGFEAHSHQQAGDPAKLAACLVELANHERPPLRFAAGSDAVKIVSDKIEQLRTELEAWRSLSVSTDGQF
jgi:NAD(P)-dependent dehydrogenase (short-subunit alcohol dehydrogenase family)